MWRALPLVVCLVATITWLPIGAVSAAQENGGVSQIVASRNLVPNPGFETTAKDAPADWVTGAPRPEISPTFSCDTGSVRSGRQSLCMSGSGRAGVVGWATARGSGVKAGSAYELTAYVRAKEVPSLHESAWVKLTWRKSEGDDFPRVAYLNDATLKNGWWRFRGTFRAPEEAALAEVTLGLRGALHGRLWWDDISLREVPAPAPRRVRLATAFVSSEQRLNPEAWQKAIKQAGEAKADAICLGEMAQLSPAAALEARPTIPGPATEVLGTLARRYHMMIIVSVPEWQGPLWYNTAVIIGKDGRLIGRYRKTHLPQNEVEAGSTAGSTLPVFDTEIGRIGVQICYDQFFPEVTRVFALQGAEIVFCPIWGDGRADNAVYDAVVRTRAVDNSVYYVTSTYNLRSLIADPSGRILADTAGKPGVVFADVDLDAPRYEPWLSVTGAAEFRYLWPRERRPALYNCINQDR